MSLEELRESAEFAALLACAARLGRDPLQVQGPGGNVSIKSGGLMWVKASGTWLADARSEDIFAPVDAAAMKAALRAGDPRADAPQEFLLGEGALRPSIETSFHAALDAPVVLHTHPAAVIAQAIRTTPPDLPAGTVAVRYEKPGSALAAALLEAWHPGAHTAVLSNHGVIATGATVAEAEARIHAVTATLDTGAPRHAAPSPALASALDGSGWRALGPGATTALAFDPARLDMLAGGAFYPDHVIFLGPGATIAQPGEGPPDAAERAAGGGPGRALVLMPGLGAAIPETASPAAEALAMLLGEVIGRLPPGEELRHLRPDQEAALLGWDAEKHRQALEAARTARLRGQP